MVESRFIRTIRRAQRVGQKKLKKIAPKYTPPPSPTLAAYDRARDGPKISSGSSRATPTPTPAPTPPKKDFTETIQQAKAVGEAKIQKIAPTGIKRRLPEPAPLEVQKAPTVGERFARQRREKGLVKGSLAFLGGETSAAVFRGQEKAVREFGGKFDVQMAELSGAGAGLAPYFTPAGPAILAAGGTEELVTPSGRARIKAQRQFYESKGWNPGLATTTAYGLPLLEAGIGLVGVKTQVARAKELKAIRQAKTTFIATETPVSTTRTRVGVFGETRVGGKSVIGVSTQDIAKVGDDISAGVIKTFQITGTRAGVAKGRVGVLVGKKPQFTPGIATSVSQQVGKGRRFIAPKPGEIGLFDPAGRAVLGKARGLVSPPTGTIGFDKTFAGTFKRVPRTDLFVVRGGTPSALRIYPQRISYKVPETLRGVLFRARKPPAPSPTFARGVGTIKRTKVVEKTVLGQAATLAETAKISAAADVAKVSPFLAPTTRTATKTITDLLKAPKVKKKQQVSEQTLQSGLISFLVPPQTRKQPKTATLSDAASAIDTAQVQQPRQITSPVRIPQTKTPTISRPAPIVPPTLTPRTRVPIRPLRFPFGLGETVLLPTPTKRKRGWMPQAREAGGVWRNVAARPRTRSAALGRMAQVVDNTTSSQGRIVPSAGKVSPRKNNYFDKNKRKFRPYRLVKGRPIALNNRFIEKRRYRIDTRGEKLGLNVARFLAQPKPKRKRRRRKK